MKGSDNFMAYKKLSQEEKEANKPLANQKRREATVRNAKAKRQAKVKELEKTLEMVESGDIQTKALGQEKYLPNSIYQQTMTGNEIYANAIRNNIIFYKQTPVMSDDELSERLAWFFEHCFNTGQLITFEKLGLATGYTKGWVCDILNGKNMGFSKNTATILKKAREFVATLDGELALQSKIQPVVYMFRAKNFYGMADKQEHVITPNNPLGDSSDYATIEAKYEQLPNE